MKIGWGGRHWTKEERKQLQIMRDQGMSYRQIGRILGRTRDACSGQSRDRLSDYDGERYYETDAQRELRLRLYGEQRYA